MSPALPLLRPPMSTLHLFLPQGMRLPTASVPAGVRLHHHAGGKDVPAQLAGLDGEGHVLLVLPARRAARGALSGAVSRGRAVGLLFSDDAEWVRAYLAAGAGTPPGRIERAVLAQWQDEYLDSGRYWLRRLRDLPDARALNWMGDRVGADTVCRRMASGARMCAYFGHGHPEGLSGYHGLYYPEVLQHAVRRPVESFVSFSCRQLAQPANRPCFGRVMVEQHRVRAFWGAVDHVSTASNSILARLGADLLGCSGVRTVGDWLVAMDDDLKRAGHAALRRAWRDYRLLGDPRTPI